MFMFKYSFQFLVFSFHFRLNRTASVAPRRPFEKAYCQLLQFLRPDNFFSNANALKLSLVRSERPRQRRTLKTPTATDCTTNTLRLSEGEIESNDKIKGFISRAAVHNCTSRATAKSEGGDGGNCINKVGQKGRARLRDPIS